MSASASATSTRQPFSWRAALHRPSALVALVAVAILAIVWGVMIYQANRPKTLDERTREVASEIQCPVCNGESVEDSPSGLAAEMRALIRQKLAQGESEQQVVQYFEQRYGDTILESPPATGFTTLIWLPPILMIVVGGYLVFTVGREWSAPRPALATAGATGDMDDADDDLDLSDEERRRLREALLRELERDEGIPFGSGSAHEKEAL